MASMGGVGYLWKIPLCMVLWNYCIARNAFNGRELSCKIGMLGLISNHKCFHVGVSPVPAPCFYPSHLWEPLLGSFLDLRMIQHKLALEIWPLPSPFPSWTQDKVAWVFNLSFSLSCDSRHSFFICTMGIIMMPTLQGEWVNICKMFRTLSI